MGQKRSHNSREHSSSPRLHDADFMDSRIVVGVKQQPAPPEMLPLGLARLLGALSLILAIVLTALVLAKHSGGRSGADFSSQVLSARAELPELSVSEFQAPDRRGVVIWIEGADYIPAAASVR